MTTGGDVRGLVDDLFDGRVYRDKAPDQAEFPYATFLDASPDRPSMRGDGGTSLTWVTTVLLDVWQLSVDEDDDLVPPVVARLDGAPLSGGSLRARVVSRVRVPDPEVEVVHDALEVDVYRLA